MSNSILNTVDTILGTQNKKLDAVQIQVVNHLDDLLTKLIAPSHPSIRFRMFGSGHRKSIPGLYIWGGVGRGKTFLMDIFYAHLPFKRKQRMHFQHFMKQVHHDLSIHSGKADPLQIIAREWAEKYRVICLDEFFVADITDAMLLGELLKHLFAENLTLITTSNLKPDLLYENGLQRQRFLPAIDLLKNYTKIIRLDGDKDYRLTALKNSGTYFLTTDPDANQKLQNIFRDLTSRKPLLNQTLSINNRPIIARQVSGDNVWFEFEDICGGPRSQLDYIEIANNYQTIMISNTSQMDAGKDDSARRFISLVDEFYDQQIKLLLSAEVAIPELYTGTNLAFAFERTTSRLLEMQSEQYMSMKRC